MIPNNFKRRSPTNKRPSYMRYDDVFMSKDSRPADRQPQHRRDSDEPDRARFAKNFSSKDDYMDDSEYIGDYDDSYSEEEESGFAHQSQRDRDFFTNGQSIVDERMVKYQKRQLPPLQRYSSANPRDLYISQNSSSYWSDQEEYRPRKNKGGTLFGAIWQKFVITFTSILSLVCLSWVAYNWNSNKPQNVGTVDGNILIEPEQNSFKVLPDNPGGENVPHQDKMVYERVNPNVRYAQTEERLLPPQERPMQLSQEEQQPMQSEGHEPSYQDDELAQNHVKQNAPIPRDMRKQQQTSAVEEYSIVDDKVYYIKLSAGKTKPILDSEAKLLKKKFGATIGDKSCVVKKVSKASGEQQYAILIGPFDSQNTAADIGRKLGGQCYVISVKE